MICGELGRAISDATVIFPSPAFGLDKFSEFYSGERSEYVALTVRQLRAGLLRLAESCRGGASVFPVGKAGGKQWVVWNGTRVSLAAARPPAPLHLADPASFGMLDVPSGVQLRVTKRDCKTWFYKLQSVRRLGVSLVGRELVGRNFSVLVSLTVTFALSVALPNSIRSSLVRGFGRWVFLGLPALPSRRC